jgi:hypothetical protein
VAKKMDEKQSDGTTVHKAEVLEVAELKSHPRNYREHPEDQLTHIAESIKEHGFYRNVVVARDGTILAGHGVVAAAVKVGLKRIPVIRLDIDPDDPKALKVLTGDNEISRLAEINDRALSEALKEIKDTDLTGLLGTGYDDQMLANLVLVTRPADEIADFDEAAEWVGMPDHEIIPEPLKIVMNFENAGDRADFVKFLGAHVTEKTRALWWPLRKRQDLSALKFEG